MNKNKKENYSLGISIIALIISVVALHINWQNLLITNRPYLKISPARYNDTGKYYSIKKCNQNSYEVIFKLQLKNIGKIPANDIHGETAVFLGLSGKGTCINADMETVLKDIYYFATDSDTFDFKSISEEQLNRIENKELQSYFREMKARDLTLSGMFNKGKTWKMLSVFPGDTFEFEFGFKISGKDAPWAIDNIDKFQKIFLKLKVTYWGIFPKIGRNYHSICNAELFDGELMPYETESY